ncbi:MAG: hypothetical protein L5655_11875 [Thermosediminibacteraceae bacterium]|nr:hypothetical protein [Thermosediminibacteraceae bacterium]
MNILIQNSIKDFVEALSSKEPVPEGAAALAGALGKALGGKKSQNGYRRRPTE